MLLHAARFVLLLLEVIVLFNLLIAVHELGHFLAAKWRGLYIEQFGIWFGKPIWQKKINGVLYSIGSIPAGGFVKLPQLAPMDMIFAEGLPNVFERHRLLAEATRRAVSVWGEGQSLSFNISEPAERSNTVTTVLMRDGVSAHPLADYCREQCGVVLGRGLGQHERKAFRVAHMGHVNAPMILGTLGVVEMGLAALNLPHGKGGVSAAVEYLAKNVPANGKRA